MSLVHLLIEAAAQTYIHIQSVEVTLEGADFCSSYSTSSWVQFSHPD